MRDILAVFSRLLPVFPAVILLAACGGPPAKTADTATPPAAEHATAEHHHDPAAGPHAAAAEASERLLPPEGVPAKVFLVNYTAAWCPNCRVLEPKLKIARALLEEAKAPVEEVRVDYTNEDTRKGSLPDLATRNLSGLLERWDGITGLVVLAAADTGEPIDCINRQFSAEAIANFAQAAIERVATTKPGSRFIGGAVCPPAGTKAG